MLQLSNCGGCNKTVAINQLMCFGHFLAENLESSHIKQGVLGSLKSVGRIRHSYNRSLATISQTAHGSSHANGSARCAGAIPPRAQEGRADPTNQRWNISTAKHRKPVHTGTVLETYQRPLLVLVTPDRLLIPGRSQSDKQALVIGSPL